MKVDIYYSLYGAQYETSKYILLIHAIRGPLYADLETYLLLYNLTSSEQWLHFLSKPPNGISSSPLQGPVDIDRSPLPSSHCLLPA